MDRADCLSQRFSCPEIGFTKETFDRGAAFGLKSITLLRSASADIEFYDGANSDSLVLVSKQVTFQGLDGSDWRKQGQTSSKYFAWSTSLVNNHFQVRKHHSEGTPCRD